MTSIVITPFDADHAEELKAFIENELDNADFEGEEMPSYVRIEDVAALKEQRDRLLAAHRMILEASMYDHVDADHLVCTMKEIAAEAITITTRDDE